MSPDVRILLLHESRYHSLLMERELARVLPDAVVAVYHSARAAVEELLKTQYQLAVIDDGLTEGDAERTISAIRRFEQTIPIVLLQDVSLRKHLPNDVSVVHKSEHFHARLAEHVKALLDTHQSGAVVRQTQEMALSVDTDLARSFVGLLAHEINNPLMIIQGLAELIAEDATHESGLSKKIELIRRAAFRIEHVMAQLQHGAVAASKEQSSRKPTVASHVTQVRTSRTVPPSLHNSD